MVPLLLAVLAPLLAPQGEPVPPSEFDRVLELKIRADDVAAIEGRGPTVFTEHEVLFDGTLHVWAKSDLDLFLQIDDATEARPMGADDNSGGGTTADRNFRCDQAGWSRRIDEAMIS